MFQPSTEQQQKIEHSTEQQQKCDMSPVEQHVSDSSLERHQIKLSAHEHYKELSTEQFQIEPAVERFLAEQHHIDLSAEQHQMDPLTEQHQRDPSTEQHQMNPFTEQHQMDPSNKQHQLHASAEQHQIDLYAQRHLTGPQKEKHKMDPSAVQHQMDASTAHHQMDAFTAHHQMESSTEQHQTNPSAKQHQMDPSAEKYHIESSTEKHQMNPSTEQHQMDPSTEKLPIEPSTEQHQMNLSTEQHQMEPSTQKLPIEPSTEGHQHEPSAEGHCIDLHHIEALTEQQASSTSLQQEATEVPVASSSSQKTGSQLDDVDIANHPTETLSNQLADDKIEPHVAKVGKPVTREKTTGSAEEATTRESTTFAQLLPSPPKVRKVEIDTAAPFESVKAAVSLFGERMDWKSQLQTRQMQMSSVERFMVSESNLHKVQDDLAYYKEKLSLTQASTADVLIELEKVKELIRGSAGTREGIDMLDYQCVPLPKAAQASEPPENSEAAVMDRHATIELQAILKEMESVKEELLSARVSTKVAVEGLQGAFKALNTVSKRADELAEEQASLNEAVAAAQIALVDAEEQVELLRSGHKVELQDKVPSDLMERKSAEINDLEEKLEEANGMVMKLKEELTAAKGVENTAVVASTEAYETIPKVKLQLDQANSEVLGTVGKLGKVLEELDELKAKLEKTTQDKAPLSSAVQVRKSDLERGRIELGRMHEKEQMACATLASLQDDLHKVKESLKSAQAGEARAVQAKETLPAAIKQAASEADEAKAAAEASKEEARKARHEMEQAKAATSTAVSRQQAALKESEAARASGAMALAEFKALTESETQGADMESQSGGGAGVTIPLQEYSSLKQAAQEAEDLADKKVTEVLAQVEEANTSQVGAQSRLDNTVKDAEMCRDELQKVQKKADDAQEAKLVAEGALRKWRAEHDQRRRAGNAPLELKMTTTLSSRRKPSNDNKVVTQDKGTPPSFQEKTVVGLDSLAQVLSLKVSTPDPLVGRVLPLEDLTKEKEKIKKTTFMRRLASIVVRKKSHSAVLT